jgi:hypothetical protein
MFLAVKLVNDLVLCVVDYEKWKLGVNYRLVVETCIVVEYGRMAVLVEEMVMAMKVTILRLEELKLGMVEFELGFVRDDYSCTRNNSAPVS